MRRSGLEGPRLRNRLRRLPIHLDPRILVRRLTRLKADSHAIAAGFASGAALSCTPLFGLHFLLAFALAWMVRGNMVAAAIGTALGNPATFPIFVTASYVMGSLAFGMPPLAADAGMMTILSQAFWITLIGSLPIAGAMFALVYFLLRPAIDRVKTRRNRRLEKP